MLTDIQISDTIWLSANDEVTDIVVQDCHGIDYIACEDDNGLMYWNLYLDNSMDMESDADIFQELATAHSIKTVPDHGLKITEKKEKKPSTPRQPTAYNMFLKEVLKELSKTHNHMSNKERMKMASVMWNDLKNI